MRLNVIIFLLAISLVIFPAMLQAETFEPTASFSVSPSAGYVGMAFTFDAGNSVDQRGFSNDLQYRWNFDFSTGGSFTEWSTHPLTTHIYMNEGDKRIALEVQDADGLMDRTFSSVTVRKAGGLSSWFQVSPTSGDTSTPFTFIASLTLPGGVPNLDDYQVRWDFNGDGTWDTPFSSNKVVTHLYGNPAFYNPRMQIQDQGGATTTVIGYDDGDPDELSFIKITQGPQPEASLEVSPASGRAGTMFYFDASRSFDRQDSKSQLQFRWDFDGNGQYELDWGSEKSPTYQYSIPGLYTATVHVRDTDGNTDQASIEIGIAEDGLPPEAKFLITTDSGLADKTLGTPNTTFSLNAGVSRDEDDLTSSLQVRWDFDGDGTYDTAFSTNKRAEYRFTDPGTYTLVLQVRDPDGLRDIAKQTVTIVSNESPVASFIVTPSSGTPGTLFDFDASEVRDSQYAKNQLEVRWDFDGNGKWDTPFKIDKTERHQYDSPGTYHAELQVRDPEGNASTHSVIVDVVSSTAPFARLTADHTSGTFSTIFRFDGAASSDDETDHDALWYRWDFDYTGPNDIQYDTSWSRTSSRSQRFAQPGDIVVRLEVKDEDGEVATALLTVSLHWASEYLDSLKSLGILRGYADGDLRPDQQITRAELLKIVMEAAGITKYGHIFEGRFSDVGRTDWHMPYIEKAYNAGIASGYADRTFRPNSPVSRAEAMKIILLTFDLDLVSYRGTFPDVKTADWFSPYVATAYHLDLISGYQDATFRPGNSMTRAEASKIIALILHTEL